MSRNELVSKVEALQEWEALMEEAKNEAEAIRDSIKAEMLALDTEELQSSLTALTLPPLKKPTANFTRLSQSRAQANASLSAHSKRDGERARKTCPPPKIKIRR